MCNDFISNIFDFKVSLCTVFVIELCYVSVCYPIIVNDIVEGITMNHYFFLLIPSSWAMESD